MFHKRPAANIALIIMPTDTRTAITAKLCCSFGPEKRLENKRPIIIPAIAPPANGTATDQFIAPINVAEATPVAEISAITASDVAKMDCICRLVTFLSAGTTTKPPPTPNKPDKEPADKPDIVNAPTQGQVHTRRPPGESSKQGFAKLRDSDAALSSSQRLLWRNISNATYIKTVANNNVKGKLGIFCASHIPAGAATAPVSAIKPAARYRTFLCLSASNAPIVADKQTASKAIGAASATARCRPKISNGTAIIAPPAPVSARTIPVNEPSKTVII